MDRHSTDLLAQFCIGQRNSFFPQDWLARHEKDGPAVALAAKYLSMTSWYGHEEELEEIAAGMHEFAENSPGLHQESLAIDFDLSYFSALVRLGLAAATRPKPVPRRERRHQHSVPVAGQTDLFDGVRITS